MTGAVLRFPFPFVRESFDDGGPLLRFVPAADVVVTDVAGDSSSVAAGDKGGLLINEDLRILSENFSIKRSAGVNLSYAF